MWKCVLPRIALGLSLAIVFLAAMYLPPPREALWSVTYRTQVHVDRMRSAIQMAKSPPFAPQGGNWAQAAGPLFLLDDAYVTWVNIGRAIKCLPPSGPLDPIIADLPQPILAPVCACVRRAVIEYEARVGGAIWERSDHWDANATRAVWDLAAEDRLIRFGPEVVSCLTGSRGVEYWSWLSTGSLVASPGHLAIAPLMYLTAARLSATKNYKIASLIPVVLGLVVVTFLAPSTWILSLLGVIVLALRQALRSALPADDGHVSHSYWASFACSLAYLSILSDVSLGRLDAFQLFTNAAVAVALGLLGEVQSAFSWFYVRCCVDISDQQRVLNFLWESSVLVWICMLFVWITQALQPVASSEPGGAVGILVVGWFVRICYLALALAPLLFLHPSMCYYFRGSPAAEDKLVRKDEKRLNCYVRQMESALVAVSALVLVFAARS